MNEDLISIDGSYGEGGGSIVRLSMAFASLLDKPISIFNIRTNRKNPGLRTQHLIGINLIHQIFGGSLEGAKVGSTNLTYIPNKEQLHTSSKITISIDTAASIGLIIQSLQIAMIKSNTELTIEFKGGGTIGLWAPTIDYIENVTKKYLTFFGLNFDINIEKHGFYPKGGSKVILRFNSRKNVNFNELTFNNRKNKTKIIGISIASSFLKKNKVAERIANSTTNELRKKGFESTITIQYHDTLSPGAAITFWTDTNHPFGTSFVSQKNLSSERVGELAVNNFYNDWIKGGILDEYMTDQIIPFMALYSSVIITGPLSNHSKTNIWICQKFLNTKFEAIETVSGLVELRSILL